MRYIFIVFGMMLLATQPGRAAPSYQFAIVNPASPSRLHVVWEPLRSYLGRKFDADIELVFPKGIGQVEKLLNQGDIDFVYLNSYLFYLLQNKGKLAPVAQMRNIEGDTTSQGRFIVRADSGIDSVEELKALTSPRTTAARRS